MIAVTRLALGKERRYCTGDVFL